MKKYRLKKKNNLIFLLSFVIMFLLMNNALALSDDAYSLSLVNGAKIYQVEKYNNSLWNSTIGFKSDPNILFEGNANVVGAKSKLVCLDKGMNNVISSAAIFSYYFFRWFNVPYYSLLNANGYNFTYINERYPIYKIWGCEFGYWNFTTTPFQDYANFTYYNPGPPHKRIRILEDPSDFSRLLYDFNDFATIINNDTAIKAANYSLPIVTGDEFLWHLIIDGFIIANPFNTYLNQMISALNCNNVTIQGKSLSLQEKGKDFFTIEVSFNSLGMIDTLLMKTTQNKVFYQIKCLYPQITVYIILGVICGGIIGLVGIYIFIKWHQKNEIATYLNQT